ncbi:MAG: DUF2752 domain-containing protein [Ruminococcaceae bacterium]|nr:DUF2752 domain-containing protein [Oscillospiraceae bacterium]
MNRPNSGKSDLRETMLLIAGIAIYCSCVYFFKWSCPVYYVTGISCPGCGMTRALFALLRLDLSTALYYHPLIFFCIVVLPVLLVVHIKRKRFVKKIITVVFVVVFFATYLYRFLVLKSPVLLFTPENGIFVRLFTSCFA